jgi:hypothetical protein
MTYPTEELGPLRESNDLLHSPEELRRRFEEDGYLFIRGLLDRALVLRARDAILHYMAEREALVPGEPVLDGVMPKGGKTVPLLGRKEITHHEDVGRILEAPELFTFFEGLYREPITTFDFKWLRAVGNEKYTGSHYDVVYMGRGSKRVHTVWIPFGDVPIEHGTLAICEGSHRLPEFERLRRTYGAMDVDRDHMQGWFSEDPKEILDTFGGRWLTADMEAGDILTFGLYTMHASTTNTTNRFRLSCDVRFQPAAEPVDERWSGPNPKGHFGWSGKDPVPMHVARARWGV